jgi:hypothetical protein
VVSAHDNDLEISQDKNTAPALGGSILFAKLKFQFALTRTAD